MNAYPNTPQAWDRTRVMARRLGVDLPRAVVEGWLTRRELDGLVCACDACADSACTSTTTPSAATLAEHAATCANRSDIESLRL